MRKKSMFLATTAVALLTGTGAAQAGDLYVSVFGGANFQHDNAGSHLGTFIGDDATTTFNMNADTGFVLGGAIGAHLDKWANGLKTELEVSYRRNDLGGHWSSFTTFDDAFASGTLNGNMSNFAIMANLWYDIDMGWKAKPYIGGGVGWARSKAEVAVAVTTDTKCCSYNGSESYSEEKSGFAWQLGAGFNYSVAPGVDVGIGYRYFRGPSFDPLFIGKNNQTAVPLDNENHSVQVNLTIGIN